MELMKTAAWSKTRPSVHHLRTSTGQEGDVVLENRKRELVGVEVKAAATVSESDFKGLKGFRELVGGRLKCGVVLYALPAGVTDAFHAAFSSNPPRWISALAAVRDRVVSVFGLKTARRGELFHEVARGDDELVLGADDRHLDFRHLAARRRRRGERAGSRLPPSFTSATAMAGPTSR